MSKAEEPVHLSVESDNLALPEVHTGKAPEEKPPAEKQYAHIRFDTVAIPEINTGKDEGV